MIALLDHTYTPPLAQDVAVTVRALMNRLRFHASFCRASAYLDIFSACQLIDPNCEEEAAAQVLVRVLSQALDRSPTWHRPGDARLSFDELWLAQVITAYQSGDIDSYNFLIRSRIAQPKRRIFHVLINHLTKSVF